VIFQDQNEVVRADLQVDLVTSGDDIVLELRTGCTGDTVVAVYRGTDTTTTPIVSTPGSTGCPDSGIIPTQFTLPLSALQE
jgi:hypothetical protein